MSAASFLKPVLYSFYCSSCTWRVRTAMILKEIPFELKPLEITSTGNLPQEFLAVNPMGQVPALVVDGSTLTQSLNILYYLEETRPQKPLLPTDALKKAKVREVCDLIVSGIQPLQNLTVVDFIPNEQRLEWGHRWISRGFKAIETLLRNSSGKYCFGDEITLADCCLIPQVYNAVIRFKIDMTEYPIMQRVYKELEKHPAFLAGHPENQPDYPKDIKQFWW